MKPHEAEPMTLSSHAPCGPHRARSIPLWLKVAYTLFVVALVPTYWRYTPLTFLWFCNAAVLLTVVALWLESSLLASTQALAILVPHLVWQIDFAIQFTTSHKVFQPYGLTPAEYMFDPAFPPLNRYFSAQHAWLLYLLLWMIWRLGYDRRAFIVQTVYAWALLLAAFLLTSDPFSPAFNVNNVYGPGKTQQTWMPQWAWLTLVMLVLPTCMYAPLHLLFRKVFRAPGQYPPQNG